MNTLALNRPAHTDTLQFGGEIKLPLALVKLDFVGRLMVGEASKSTATMGDQLRALAELYDAVETPCRLERCGLPCGCPLDQCRKGHVT